MDKNFGFLIRTETRVDQLLHVLGTDGRSLTFPARVQSVLDVHLFPGVRRNVHGTVERVVEVLRCVEAPQVLVAGILEVLVIALSCW